MAKYISKLINGEDLYYLKDTEARANLIDKTEKGAASGVATLDQNGKIPDSQLPDGIGGQVQADWDQSDSTAVDYIKNKPVSMPASDVSAWAKESTKPSYTKSEVGLSNVTNDAQVKRSEMGTASGVATLDSAGKIPSSQLPSYVDDVLEYDNKSLFPAEGETGKIYVDKDTNLSWRWGGTDYVQISPSLALGETSSTAYAGDKGKALADKLATIASGAEVNVQSDWNATSGDAMILNKPTIPSEVTETTVNGWGFTKNTGTITGITMNGSSKGTSGVVNLGTVITAHQDISGKADKATTLSGYGITDAYTKTEIDTLTRHTRKTDFDLSVLKQAVADQNLEKYGLKVGDQKTINGHTYVIAGLNCMKGSHSHTATANHVGLIVIPHTTHAWNASGNTYTGADERGAGYLNSDLHYYLKNTVLPLAQTDLGASNLITHNKLLTNAVNTTGYNRYGSATGCSSSWTWSNEYISALSEMQVYGGTVWSSSGYDTGEADQQLEVFKHYKHTDIFGNEYPWLRDVASATSAATASDYGYAAYNPASAAGYVAGLILFH